MLTRMKRLYKTWQVVREVGGLGDLPRAWSIEEFVKPYTASMRNISGGISLDIGCGGKPQNPFGATTVCGIDIRENAAMRVKYADLTVEPIPFPDQHFDYVTAGDFLEHVPRVVYLPARRFPFVQLMNEIWRVLKPNGVFYSRTPVYPFSPAFRDPTHVNLISHETFSLYFDDKCRYAANYGFTGSFKVLSQAIRPPHLLTVLQRV